MKCKRYGRRRKLVSKTMERIKKSNETLPSTDHQPSKQETRESNMNKTPEREREGGFRRNRERKTEERETVVFERERTPNEGSEHRRNRETTRGDFGRATTTNRETEPRHPIPRNRDDDEQRDRERERERARKSATSDTPRRA
jgi:hypothetical protein